MPCIENTPSDNAELAADGRGIKVIADASFTSFGETLMNLQNRSSEDFLNHIIGLCVVCTTDAYDLRQCLVSTGCQAFIFWLPALQILFRNSMNIDEMFSRGGIRRRARECKPLR